MFVLDNVMSPMRQAGVDSIGLREIIHGAGIFTYIWVIYEVNVGKYTSTMDDLGWFCWETLQDTPIEITGKSGWFPVKMFPFLLNHWLIRLGIDFGD